jgi:hypothetical protein
MKAGLRSSYTSLTVVSIADRSNALGRHWISTRYGLDRGARGAVGVRRRMDDNKPGPLPDRLLDLGGGELSMTSGGTWLRQAAH